MHKHTYFPFYFSIYAITERRNLFKLRKNVSVNQLQRFKMSEIMYKFHVCGSCCFLFKGFLVEGYHEVRSIEFLQKFL